MTAPADLALPCLGVLAIDGAEAPTFLQGQATCDTRQLLPGTPLLGALCNLQGRMLVSFHVFAVEGGLRLVMPRDRVAAVQGHLKKYAVFAKVALRDASADESVAARAGDAVPVLLPAGTPPPPADGSLAWRAVAIRAGRVLVDTANADRHLPQALNYDVIEGVSFRKGCYTGQEVVARMHFKGRMKERLRHFTASGPAPAAGAALEDAEGKTVGTVVDAVQTGENCEIAAVVRHEAWHAGGLRVAGLALFPAALPYAVPDLDTES